MIELVAGVDETATETQTAEGWTYCVLTLAAACELVKDHSAIVGHGSIKHFHGKKFKTRLEPEYRDFLAALRNRAEEADHRLLALRVMDLTWKREFFTGMHAIVENATAAAGLADPKALKILVKIVPALAELQRLLRELGDLSTIEIEIDRDSMTKALPAATFARGAASVAATKVLRGIYGGIRAKSHPRSPMLAAPGVKVVNDTKSVIIQAADVFGNFAMAYAAAEAGHPADKYALRARIFSDTFGDTLKGTSAALGITLSPKNELQVVNPGVFGVGIS